MGHESGLTPPHPRGGKNKTKKNVWTMNSSIWYVLFLLLDWVESLHGSNVPEPVYQPELSIGKSYGRGVKHNSRRAISEHTRLVT